MAKKKKDLRGFRVQMSGEVHFISRADAANESQGFFICLFIAVLFQRFRTKAGFVRYFNVKPSDDAALTGVKGIFSRKIKQNFVCFCFQNTTC